MRSLLRKFLIINFSLIVTTYLIPAIKIGDNFYEFFYSLVILSLIYQFIVPVVNVILLPINLLTLGSFKWTIYILGFYIWTIIVPYVTVSNWNFAGLNLGPILIQKANLSYLATIIIVAISFILIKMFISWVFR